MDKKNLILQFIQSHPGVKPVDIRVNLSRSALGTYLRHLLDSDAIVRDENGGWYIREGFVVPEIVHVKTPMDLAAEYIRKMIDLR